MSRGSAPAVKAVPTPVVEREGKNQVETNDAS